MHAPVRAIRSLDAGRRFNLGDIPMPEIVGHGPATYMNATAGVAWGAAVRGFDDSAWLR